MNQPAHLDSNLPICERVQDLLSRLTLDEKLAMMNHPAQGVPRLNNFQTKHTCSASYQDSAVCEIVKGLKFFEIHAGAWSSRKCFSK